MCTIGLLACRDEDGALAVYGFKNSDSPPAVFWHGRAASPGAHASLAYGLAPQGGINAGMNAHGLLLISSYFDYVEPDEEGGSRGGSASYWQGDLRGRLQAEALAACRTARDAHALLARGFAAEGAASIGGCHMIADRSGRLLVLEHCRGRIASHDETKRGWTARGNQAFGLFAEEQRRMSAAARSDREMRWAAAAGALAPLAGRTVARSEAVAALRRLLASHDGGADGVGGICAHGVLRGRSNAPLPHDTLSGLIWDVSAGAMHYTAGHPCRSEWRTIGFES